MATRISSKTNQYPFALSHDKPWLEACALAPQNQHGSDSFSVEPVRGFVDRVQLFQGAVSGEKRAT